MQQTIIECLTRQSSFLVSLLIGVFTNYIEMSVNEINYCGMNDYPKNNCIKKKFAVYRRCLPPPPNLSLSTIQKSPHVCIQLMSKKILLGHKGMLHKYEILFLLLFKVEMTGGRGVQGGRAITLSFPPTPNTQVKSIFSALKKTLRTSAKTKKKQVGSAFSSF